MEKLEQQLKKVTRDIPVETVSQGAEALVFRTNVHPYLDETLFDSKKKLVIKYRPPKPYRHEVLDAQLTKHRTLAEARILQKLMHTEVNVPKLVFVDPRRGIIWMENIEGQSIKQWIWDNEQHGVDKLKDKLVEVGHQIGLLHISGMVHGDLTTSNVMLDSEAQRPVMIDFGLGSHSEVPEDRAVDLYVLERAVTSTHPINSETYNSWLLEGYEGAWKSGGDKHLGGKLKETMRRLEDVRMRGRKRSMVG